jgi:signal transduction histidine kinase
MIQDDLKLIQKIPVIPSLLDVVCKATRMGFVAVARVTDENWVACSVRDEINFGLKPGGELPLETTICNEIRQSHKAVIIENVAEDKIYCQHHTPKTYGFQSYISMPIFRKDGRFFGTLCAIDPKPNKLKTPEIIGMFNLFCDLISFHMQSEEQLMAAQSRLREEEQTGHLRDQFISILGHDLRNPLSAITFSSEMLSSEGKLDDESLSLVNIIRKSAHRMNGLIKNILDFARGKMGGGIALNRNHSSSLGDALRHVVDEQLTSNPDRRINVDIRLEEPVYCDEGRISQLFSNLISNAVSYGDPEEPVIVEAFNRENELIISVSNTGEKIPDHILQRLFLPFARGMDKRPGQQGLGLGLYIASEIARAHAGQIEVESDEKQTKFVLRMPLSTDEVYA